MSTTIASAFSNAAENYDLERRALVPCFDDFYGCALDSLKLDDQRDLHILDLGAGTGLFAAMVCDLYPNSRFRLIDLSSEMLAKATKRFARFMPPLPEIVVADYATIQLCGPYDAIISSLSIHHLSHEAKQSLFVAIHDALKPGGMFVNAEQVLGETQEVENNYEDWWQRMARTQGATKDTIARAKDRMKFDQCAPVKIQLKWMRNAGFQDAACIFQDHRFAVLTGSA